MVYTNQHRAYGVRPETELFGTLLIHKKTMVVVKKKADCRRRVTFSDKNQIFIMWVWLYAANKARSIYWEKCAADRVRFQKRIKEVGTKIEWVLSDSHRSSMYKNNEQVRCQLDGGETSVH
ncbi:Clas38 [Clostera anastomosis granulovirus B]|uniref:Clas38 n=1 Tax=Clostera anastomosis granulovirus B TaxID=1986290 RepID=A0A0K0WS63_9BBAC|nr:Clas38 [Clostera anastomosis granulovirus B]AKS25381.1 Clas38 [Clostera anastomosis granulovirus B]